VWRAECIETMTRGCAQELADWERQSATLSAGGCSAGWDRSRFQVEYPQLAPHLYVPPFYIRPLIRCLAARASPAAQLQLPMPHAYMNRLWQHSVVTDADEDKAALLDALAAVQSRYGDAEHGLSCIPYCIWLLSRREPQCSTQLAHAALSVLAEGVRFGHELNLRACEPGLDVLSSLLPRLSLDPDIVAAATAEAETEAEAEGRAAEVPLVVCALDLLQTLALSSRRLAAPLCAAPHIHRIAQSVLCGEAAVIGRAVELLSILADVQPSLGPALHRCGIFRFLLAAVPERRHGGLPLAAAAFFTRFDAVRLPISRRAVEVQS